MGEEKVKTDTLEIGTDTTATGTINKKKGLPNEQKKNTKRQQANKNVRKAQLEEEDNTEVGVKGKGEGGGEGEGGGGGNRNNDDSNENRVNKTDSDNTENVSTNGISAEKKKEKSKKQTNGEIETEKEKEKEYSVKQTSQEFKLRLVPLERLLCSTKKAALEKEKTKSIKKDPETGKTKNVARKLLPQRSKRNNQAIIEISSSGSSSSNSSSEDEPAIQIVEKNKKKEAPTTSQAKVKASEKSKKKEEPLKKPTSTSSSSSSSNAPRLKRCVVRLKRISWPNQVKKAEKPKQKEKEKEEEKGKGREKEKEKEKEKEGEKEKEKEKRTQKSSTDLPTKEAASSRKRSRSPSRSRSSSVTSAATTTTSTSKSKKMEKPSGSKKRKKHDLDSDSDFEISKEIHSELEQNNDSDDHKRNNNDNVSDDDDDDNNDDDEDDANSSDSEIIPTRKKRIFTKKTSGTDDSDFEPKAKSSSKAKKQRRRIKNDSDDDGSDDDDDDKNKHKRKDIRKIIKTKDLDLSTKEAAKEEDERRKRIEERQKLYNQIYENRKTEEINELVLDFDEESKEALLQVDAGLLKKLKPHQVTGVKFMWDACFETVADTVEKPGSGCILAHCMGLGKTLQIVTLSHTLLVNSRKTNVERVLIISPLSTLNNWAREFKQWMGFARKKNIEIYDMSRYKDKHTRIFKLKEWFEEGGVCIIGYDLYRILANEKAKGLKKKQREELQQSLVDPGPDLVVCDEGHLLKNEKTSISKAVTRMRTRRRIVLTGTPLQNNLKEYYCMIQFIKPNLLGTYKEYLNRFVNPITNGQYTDSTERDIRLMRHRSHILHKLLEGCIQRRDYSVLAPYLPPKHEYVIYTTLSDLQQKLYEYYMTTQRDVNTTDICGKGARLFQDFQDLRRIWTHPMNLRVNSDTVIRKRIMADDWNSIEDFICDDDDDDDESAGGRAGSSSSDDADSSKSFASGGGGGGGGKPRKTRRTKQINGNESSDQSDSQTKGPDDPSEWWKQFADEAALNNLHHSPKLLMLMRLLEQCEKIGDKLLVFSQSLQSLDVIEHFLSLIDRKTCGEKIEGDVGDISGRWRSGVDYFRLDGSSSVENREDMCKRFNDSKNLRARLFLISTRAGGLGINLVAANRVVIFDVSWNPSHDTQSIFRVYRFGQTKPCYIYRLIAIGTMEQKVYERQVTKQATAKRVIDEQQISRHYNQSDLQELYTYELKPVGPREIPILPKDRLFAELLSDYDHLIFKYHEHDSLLENEDSENLSEEDRKAAWSEYEAEKTRATQTSQYIAYDRTAYPNATGAVTSSRIFGFRSDVLLHLLNMKVANDNPDFNQNQITQLVPAYLDRLYSEMHNDNATMYRELMALNASLIQPGSMYMNPLLYANQNPQAAGYYQAPHIQQQPDPNILGLPTMPVVAPRAPPPHPQLPAPGFNAGEVYEID